MRPWFAPLIPLKDMPPTLELNPSMLGFCRKTSLTFICSAAISLKDVPCAASVLMNIWSISWSGMNPLGIFT